MQYAKKLILLGCTNLKFLRFNSNTYKLSQIKYKNFLIKFYSLIIMKSALWFNSRWWKAALVIIQ